MRNNTQISEIIYHVVDLEINLDNITTSKYITTYTQRGLSSIKNAWKRYAIVDSVGCLWVQKKGIKSILRLGTNYREFIEFNINEYHKKTIEGKTYIRINAVGDVLIHNISSHQYDIGKRNYSKFSLKLLNKLNEHPFVDNIRENQRQHFLRQRSKLKHNRIKEFGLINDELTGQKLISSSCEFSHIRSVASYPDLALYVWNGLIVNKETHDRITKRGVNNEVSLNEMCNQENWKKTWIGQYRNDIESYGYRSLV